MTLPPDEIEWLTILPWRKVVVRKVAGRSSLEPIQGELDRAVVWDAPFRSKERLEERDPGEVLVWGNGRRDDGLKIQSVAAGAEFREVNGHGSTTAPVLNCDTE